VIALLCSTEPAEALTIKFDDRTDTIKVSDDDQQKNPVLCDENDQDPTKRIATYSHAIDGRQVGSVVIGELFIVEVGGPNDGKVSDIMTIGLTGPQQAGGKGRIDLALTSDLDPNARGNVPGVPPGIEPVVEGKIPKPDADGFQDVTNLFQDLSNLTGAKGVVVPAGTTILVASDTVEAPAPRTWLLLAPPACSASIGFRVVMTPR
jgi:hypothetical protein